jgi:hypothetical protein
VQVDARDPLLEEVTELVEALFDPGPHVVVGMGPALRATGRVIDGGAAGYGTQVG